KMMEIAVESSSKYYVAVSALLSTVPPGSYRINVAEKRAATKQDIDRFTARRNFHSAVNLYNRMDLESVRRAVAKCQTAAALWQTLGDHREEGIALNLTGLSYALLGESQEAIKTYEQAIDIFQRAGVRDQEANSLNNMARTYFILGEYQRSLDFYNQALRIRREIGDGCGEASVLRNLGDLYFDLGELQRARDIYNQTLAKVRAKLDNEYNIMYEASALFGLGRIASRQNEAQKALEYFTETLQRYRITTSQVRTYATLLAMGD